MNQLLTIENLRSIDSESMYKTYDKWPHIAKDSYKNLLPKIDLKNINHVVFAGMGGSGAIGDVFASILSKMDIHVTVVKGYQLPKTVNENTLVVCTSISGNTDETLTILQNSNKSNAKFIGLSSGGLMEKYCKKNSIDYYMIKKEHSPRASFIGFLYSTLNILEPIIPINKNEIEECSANKNLQIKDLTGAGDLFAAGFLHGHVNKSGLSECLQKGTEMSSKVIQQIGARL